MYSSGLPQTSFSLCAFIFTVSSSREEELERQSVLVLDGKFNTRFISITSLRGRENS